MSFAPLFVMMDVVKKERRVGSARRGWGRRRGGKRAQKTRLTFVALFFAPASEHSHVADSVVDRRALDTIEHVAAVAHILDNILNSFTTFSHNDRPPEPLDFSILLSLFAPSEAALKRLLRTAFALNLALHV